MHERLGAWRCDVEVEADYFKFKAAPKSGVESWIDSAVRFSLLAAGDRVRAMMSVETPVGTLCPCSKEISDYGAHNQRSLVAVRLDPGDSEPPCIGDVVDAVERHASVQLYGLLKRQDEKFVTEHAYENPKFVEDIVRDIASEIARLYPSAEHSVSAENFESIHNHSAYAEVVSEGFEPMR